MRASVACLVACLALSPLAAQQPNSAGATLTINGLGGPPYPVQGAAVFTGTPSTFSLGGSPAVPYWVATAPTLSAGELTTPYGILDLPFASLNYLWQGEDILDGFGVRDFTFTIPQNLPLTVTAAYQAGMVDPTSAAGATFSAATSIVVQRGIVTGNVNVGNESSQSVSLTPYNLAVAYYAQTYSNFFVNSEGSVSFNGANTDFTATSGEFRSQQARIAMFWSDLDPTAGGASITWQIDFSTGIPTLELEFDNVGESRGPTLRHFFTLRQQLHTPGDPFIFADITLVHPAANPPASYDTVVGISPGGNLSSAQPMDLGLVQDTGGHFGMPNEAIYEFFRGIASTVTPPGAAPTYDLTNRELYFQAIGPGASGASYFYF
jgi:hypothetical protein